MIQGFTIISSTGINQSTGINLYNNSSPVIRNNVVLASGVQGYAIIIGASGSRPTIINNTIKAWDTDADTVDIVISSGSPIIKNNILIGDGGQTSRTKLSLGIDANNGSIPQEHTYNYYYNHNGDFYCPSGGSCYLVPGAINCAPDNTCTLGTGEVFNNASVPIFNDATANDYRLISNSVGVNMGDSGSGYNDPDGSRNDMGAFGGPYAYEGVIQATSSSSLTTSDTLAPSTPTNLTAIAVSSSQIDLSWTASTDNIRVDGYKIYRNGVFWTNYTAATTLSDSGRTASTAYTYTVAAYDAVGNASAQSSSVSATTFAISAHCATQSISGYSVPATNTGTNVTVTQITSVPNGTRTATTTFTCNNGSFTAGPEMADITCDSGYNSIGTQCVQNTTSLPAPTGGTNTGAYIGAGWPLAVYSIDTRAKNLAAISHALTTIKIRLLELLRE